MSWSKEKALARKEADRHVGDLLQSGYALTVGDLVNIYHEQGLSEHTARALAQYMSGHNDNETGPYGAFLAETGVPVVVSRVGRRLIFTAAALPPEDTTLVAVANQLRK